MVHIFENEWVNRQSQVKSFLKSKLGKNSRYLYARKTEVREVPAVEAKRFLNEFHIQGACNFKTALGLYNNNELVALLTVGLHHRNNIEWVLSRFVCREGVTVVGGLSKLTKVAVNKFGSLSTWVDLRWSNGKSWISLGWELVNVLPPDYFYINTQDTRVITSKQSRKKSSVGTPEGMTELEHAKLDGFSRVWDCGKLKLVYKKT